MTPGARGAAAIGLLDAILAGAPAEKALTTWARSSRFAGSGDRAAVRDLVFDGLRRRRSAAALGGAETGRGLLLGLLRGDGVDPATIFTGEGHAPPPLTAEEIAAGRPPHPGAEASDCPDWLWPVLEAQYGPAAGPLMAAQQDRAPVFLRAVGDRDDIIAALAQDGIAATPHPDVKTALQVTGNPRRLQSSRAYLEGRVELQDAASQAAVLALPLEPGMRVLDYCAGGGGKSLAMAARMPLAITAHDADPGRMADIGPRAARAGVRIELTRQPAGAFDLVLVDAPCSGSGTWRRAPEAKWRLDAARLAELTALQAEILDRAARHVLPGGHLAYATCSILQAENEAQRAGFAARHPGWEPGVERLWRPEQSGDGFYLSVFRAPPRR